VGDVKEAVGDRGDGVEVDAVAAEVDEARDILENDQGGLFGESVISMLGEQVSTTRINLI
jgi:hypothetical protein